MQRIPLSAGTTLRGHVLHKCAPAFVLMSRCSPTQHGSVQLHITAPALGDCSPGGPSRSVRTARRYPCRRRSVPPDPHHDRVGRRDYCRCRRASRARSSAVSFCRAYLQKHHLTLRQRGIRAGLLTPLSFSSCDAARFRSAVATRKREGQSARFVEFQQPPVCACSANGRFISVTSCRRRWDPSKRTRPI